MNSLFSHYDRSVSRRLSRHGGHNTHYGGKRRPATTEKLQAGETYGMGRHAPTSDENNYHHQYGSSSSNINNSHHSSMLSSMRGGGGPSAYHSPYDHNTGGSSGRFLQDIHIPSRSQRMPTPMPMRHHHREMLGRSSSLPNRTSKYNALESNLGHESSSTEPSPPGGGGAHHPLLMRTMSRKGTARGSGNGGSIDTNSLLGGSGANLEGAGAASMRRRHKSDSAAMMYTQHHELQQPLLVGPSSQSIQPPPTTTNNSSTSSGLSVVRAGSSHGGGMHNKPGTSSGSGGGGSRWQLQLPDINHSGSSGLQQQQPAGASGQTQQQQQQLASTATTTTTTSSYTTRRGKSRHHLLHSSSQQQLLKPAEPEFLTHGGTTCGLCTIKGLKPGNPNWQNQDSFVICENVGPKKDLCIYGVLDGHGEVGHLVSNRCREQLPIYLSQVDFDPVRACRLMQQDLVACQTMDVQCSGATCVLAVLRTSNNTLTVANLGDSRCVLARLQQPQQQQQQHQLKTNSSTAVVAVPLTRDHKPDRPDEHQRILAAGGQVGCRQIILSQRTSHPVTLPMGPPRVWYQCRGEIMGLAMSRSLGDSIVHTVGGSSEPEITDYKLCPGDTFMVIASDGIWDVVDNNQAIQIVQSYASRNPGDWDAKEAANILSRFARHRWQTVSSMVDDITCLVVKLPRHNDKGQEHAEEEEEDDEDEEEEEEE